MFSLLCAVPLSSHIKTHRCRSQVISLPSQDCDTVHLASSQTDNVLGSQC